MEGRGWQLQRGESTNCNQAQQSLNLARGTGCGGERGSGDEGAGARWAGAGGWGQTVGPLYSSHKQSLAVGSSGKGTVLGQGGLPAAAAAPGELTAEATCTSTGRVLGQELRVHLSDNR